MAKLPIFQTSDRILSQLQTQWASQINPQLSNPALNSSILKQVRLISGTTVVNHLLGKALQGWRIVRKRAAADIYDNQDQNQTPDLTLILVSDAAVTVDLEVF